MNHYDDPAFFEAYAQMDRSRFGLEAAGEWQQMQPLFPELSGKAVLDLGCGYGWHCRYATERGAAKVVGIDQSEKMIARAMECNPAENITHHVCSLQRYEYPPDEFDVVVSNLVLHYVQDLEEVYRLVYRTLRPGGVFVMNVEHPTFTAGVNQQFAGDGTWPVDDYYYPGERQTDFLGHTITKYHHTLTQILGGLLNVGFRLEAVEEAMPPEGWRCVMPQEMRRPMMLLVKAAKESIHEQ